MRRILVTGGAGFIGSNFVRHAIGSGNDVVVLDSLEYSGNRASLDDVLTGADRRFIHGSINDRALVAKLLARHSPDLIINFAAESHVDRSIDEPQAFIQTNICGVFELLEAALAHWRERRGAERDRFRFVQISTDEVYGSIAEGRAAEGGRYAPNSPYAASKAAADHLVRAYNRTYGLPTLISNCGNNYGPYQFPEKLIPLTILNALELKPLPIYGDGLHEREWLYVEDHCGAVMDVAMGGGPGQSYNIGTGEPHANLSIVEKLCRTLDDISPRADGKSYRELVRFVQDRPGHDRRYALDPRKIARDLGWKPKVGLDEGLKRTVAWYIENNRWWQGIRDNSYRGERLGLHRKDAALGTGKA